MTMLRFVLILLLMQGVCLGQGNYKLSLEQSKILVKGTSTLHDWESVVEQGTGSCNMKVENGKISSLQSLKLSFPVKGIKSGKKLMDSKTYEALKEDNFPQIQLVLKEVKSIDGSSGKNQIQMISELTIAGVKKSITTNTMVQVLKNGHVSSSGTFKLKMTTFSIEPPTAMMGSIKCGDEITIEYKVVFIPS